ncbi:MAG TPA: type II toxin-antitoxin system prevent-host-death family antitoxin [Verrucomicrobiae bacterium]|jgi:prevent-host-death family protein|nr:type II toxin-antitoxin system prevent-host-death family antitoxin [Verrucomicrobiae bacterium]
MKTWTLTDAKSRFSAVVDAALTHGPQEVSVATKEPVIIIAKRDLDKLTPGGVKAFFDRAPKLDKLAEVLAGGEI